MIGLTRYPNRRRDVRIRLEAGVGSDQYVAARRDHGPFTPGDSGFRFNRGVDEGRYGIASVKLELHPDVNSAFVRPGIGAVLRAEAATGDLAWRRAELRIVARRMLGPFILCSTGGRGRGRRRLDPAATAVRAWREPEFAGVRLQGVCRQPSSRDSRTRYVSTPALARAVAARTIRIAECWADALVRRTGGIGRRNEQCGAIGDSPPWDGRGLSLVAHPGAFPAHPSRGQRMVSSHQSIFDCGSWAEP